MILKFSERAWALFFIIMSSYNLVIAQNLQSDLTPKFVQQTMKKVCDYQLANLQDTTVMSNGVKEVVPENGWVRGVFYTGVIATYKATADVKYLNKSLEWGKSNSWKLGPSLRHADDQAVAQTYIQLYEIKKNPEMIAQTRLALDSIIANPLPGEKYGWAKNKNWSWCDALYMSPPVYAMLSKATGNQKYLEAMDTMWKQTSAYLYDKKENLFYRDVNYKPNINGTEKREPNGSKVFWSRGNGWVLAGLAKVLTYMPVDYKNRNWFIKQYKEMAVKIASLQGNDGLWRSSLYDPKSFPYPETSGSSLYCYALAWGINHQILPKKQFKPVVESAWNALVSRVELNGKLGAVQKVGHEPGPVNPEDSNEYAVGAFLNAGLEILKLEKASK